MELRLLPASCEVLTGRVATWIWQENYRVKLMFLIILYIIGITAEGITGALAAGKRKMDLFGVMFIACATAIGGGSVRDMLFGHYPLTWVAHPEYLFIVCAAALITTRMPYFFSRFERTFLVLDALGLAVFSVIGARIGMEYHSTGSIALIGAVVTGVFGGILRDIFCARVPLVFQKELYASIALLTGLMYVAIDFVSDKFCYINENINIIACLITGFVTRLIAIRYHLGLPVFTFLPNDENSDSANKTKASSTTSTSTASEQQTDARPAPSQAQQAPAPEANACHAAPEANACPAAPEANTAHAASYSEQIPSTAELSTSADLSQEKQNITTAPAPHADDASDRVDVTPLEKTSYSTADTRSNNEKAGADKSRDSKN